MDINWKSLIGSIAVVCFLFSFVLIFRLSDISWSPFLILLFVIMFCLLTLVLYYVIEFGKKRREKKK